MTPGVRRSLVSSAVLVALIAVAGCSHYLLAEREPWRHEAELACINSGVPQEVPGRVRISTISGPGACGIDYPLKVSELGESRPLGYDDEPPVPPGAIPPQAGESGEGAPQHWPIIQSRPLPPPPQTAAPYEQPQYGQRPYDAPSYRPPSAPPPYGQSAPYGAQPYGQPYASPQNGPAPYGPPQAGAPMSLTPPGLSPPAASDPDAAGSAPHPYYDAPNATPVDIPSSLYSPRPMMATPAQEAAPVNQPIPPLGPPPPPFPPPQAAGPVELTPGATLACPIVSALDKWINDSVQPAALKWFRQPVVEIKQIGAYSCRGMINGNPNAPISEHAFGNALDIAEFDLADGHKISVQYGWRGTPEEQGFLHDVQGAACQDFTTVLAPGANVYHYNHIHVDLMRRASRRYICEPGAIPGEVAAARARARYAAHYGRRDVTGSIGSQKASLYPDDDDQLPLAVPGDD